MYKIGFVFANEGAIECMTRFRIAILLRGDFLNNVVI
jgi:hypothetical protein